MNRNKYILINSLSLSPYQTNRDNQEIIVNTLVGSVSVILPDNPILGTTVVVVDATGNASTNPITISANNQLINGQPNFTVNQDYAAAKFIYDTLNNDQVGILSSGGAGLPTPLNPATLLVSNGSAFVENNNLLVQSNYVQNNIGIVNSAQINISTNFFNIAINHYMVLMDTLTAGIPLTVNLPNNPILGEIHVIKDAAGSSSGLPITVNGGPYNIDGSTTFIINNAQESFTFRFNGTQQNLI